MWFTIFQIGLKLAGFFFSFLGNKKESKIWMAKASETLRQKGLVRSKFVLELEADRDDYLEKMMNEKLLEKAKPIDVTEFKKEAEKVKITKYKYLFGASSLKNLNEAVDPLQKLFREVIKLVDCKVIEGHRPKAEQDEAFNSGKSKLKFPNSKHNSMPSKAVDVVPWPLDWEDTKRFYRFGELVVKTAKEMNIDLRWGGDWDGDGDYTDQTFNDLVHFELR